ncbi:MAG: hypothetical protein AAFO82_24520, partial [Bacteroidota bacterium]
MDSAVANRLASIDLDDLIPKMEYYALLRLKGIDEKDMGGDTIQDLIFRIIEKALTGVRRWDHEKGVEFEQFLFGCLKSEISEFFRKKKFVTSDIPELLDNSAYEDFEVLDVYEKIRFLLEE